MNSIFFRSIVPCCCLVFSLSVQSQEQAAEVNIKQQVDALFADWDSTETPGCALSVSQNGEMLYARGYGMANLETGTPISTNSIFHVASISKQFTAMSLLLLQQDGKLSLDDDIHKYLPEVPDFGETITIRNLLHHTSGMRDQWELLWLAGWREDDVKSEQDILGLVARQKALNFSPGEEYLYSNTGFTLAGTIVHRVSGMSLKEFTIERIFKPLGMNDTHFHDDHTHLVKHRTSAYEVGDEGELSVSIPVFDNAGATSLFTTVEDFVKWGRNFHEPQIGGKQGQAELLKPIVLNNGESQDYALGIAVGSYRGLETIGHGGADAGYRSNFLHFPDQEFSVAVFCNASRAAPWAMARGVADVYLAEFLEKGTDDQGNEAETIELTTGMLESYSGVYFHEKSANLRKILVKDGGLVYYRGENSESKLAAVSENRFVMLEVGAEVYVWFEPAPENGFIMNVVVDDDSPLAHMPVETVEYTSTQLEEFSGDYYSEELDVTYRLFLNEDQLTVDIPRQEQNAIKAMVADTFAGSEGSVIKFARDEKGQVAGMELSGGRVRNLAFERQN